jgi:hypothetical protein
MVSIASYCWLVQLVAVQQLCAATVRSESRGGKRFRVGADSGVSLFRLAYVCGVSVLSCSRSFPFFSSVCCPSSQRAIVTIPSVVCSPSEPCTIQQCLQLPLVSVSSSGSSGSSTSIERIPRVIASITCSSSAPECHTCLCDTLEVGAHSASFSIPVGCKTQRGTRLLLSNMPEQASVTRSKHNTICTIRVCVDTATALLILLSIVQRPNVFFMVTRSVIIALTCA